MESWIVIHLEDAYNIPLFFFESSNQLTISYFGLNQGSDYEDPCHSLHSEYNIY